jgi:prepilin-type N-terminal cleavage/methylation domain-containing protein
MSEQMGLSRATNSGGESLRTGQPTPYGNMQTCALSAGFSLVELLVVVSVMLIVAAFALPTLTTTLDAYRVRSTLGSASNVAQMCRTQAVKQNVSQRVHFVTTSNRVVLFVTRWDDVTSVLKPVYGDPLLSTQFWFPDHFSIPGAPGGAGAPPLLTSLQMWGTNVVLTNVNVDAYFNARGMPCLPNAVTGVCDLTNGYVYYYRYQGGGSTRWSATSISPAGRIQSWFWNGTSWGN